MLRIILVLFSLIKIFAYENFKKYLELKKDDFENNIPYKFQFSSDGNITFSTDMENTEVYKSNMFKIDSGSSNSVKIFDKIFEEKKINSVRGFYIDNDDNYYLLDQGEIDSLAFAVKNGTSKIILVSSNKTANNDAKILKNISSDFKYSSLTDIVVEHSGEYAYIVDSGNPNPEHNNPGIIVVNLLNENEKEYKVLNNRAPFNSSKNIGSSTEGKRELDKFLAETWGEYTVQLSCNDETLYYSSKKDTKIYSVSTKEIKSAIKKYKNSNAQGDLDKITVYSADKGFNIYNFVISNRNNMFILNNDMKNIDVSFNLNKDLSNYNIVNTTKMNFSEDKNNIFYSIDAFNGSLYILGISEQKDSYSLDKAEIKKEEYNSNIGCSVFIFKISGADIFIFVYFFLVLVLTIIIIIANSGNALEKSKLKKEEAKQANLDELNKTLNE